MFSSWLEMGLILALPPFEQTTCGRSGEGSEK
jgi:hypothetical protein